MKKCKICNYEKELLDFKKTKYNKDGRTNTCKACLSIKERAYRVKNKEKISTVQRIYYNNNKEKITDYRNKWQEENKDHLLEYRTEYLSKNKKRISDYNKQNRVKLNKYRKELKLKNPTYAISEKVRCRIHKALKSKDLTKTLSTAELTGCSIKFLKEYLESKFTKGMSWENYGQYGWHIDHIKPCASFNLLDPEEQKKCFHYTNLQPLWATKSIAILYGELDDYTGNLEKGARQR